MKNNFIVQIYLESTGFWMDVCAFPTILEAVDYYKQWKKEQQSIDYRIVQLFEVEDEK